jgi:hypothetical protein
MRGWVRARAREVGEVLGDHDPRFANSRHESFIHRFDPATGMLQSLEAMRYKDRARSTKTLWISQTQKWSVLNGYRVPTVAAVTWLDEGTPWAVFTVEDVRYNQDVSHSIRAKGP